MIIFENIKIFDKKLNKILEDDFVK